MMMIETTSQEVAPGSPVLMRWAEFGPAAPVGAELLDRDLGGHRTHGEAWVPASSVLAFADPWNVIRTQVHEQDGHDDRQLGTRTKTRPQVSIEIAEMLVAAQSADHGKHHSQTASRCDKLEPDHRAELAEVRQQVVVRPSNAADSCWSRTGKLY